MELFKEDFPIEKELLIADGAPIKDVARRIGTDVSERARAKGEAYEYFEEDRKGILKAGAVADLVILDRDPTAVPPMKIKDIRVPETVKGGQTVFVLEEN